MCDLSHATEATLVELRDAMDDQERFNARSAEARKERDLFEMWLPKGSYVVVYNKT